MSDESGPWRAVLRPLEFAERQNFKFLGRIRGLEESVRRAAARAIEQTAADQRRHELLHELVRALPAADAGAEERRQALRQCLEIGSRMVASDTSPGEERIAPQSPSPAPAVPEARADGGPLIKAGPSSTGPSSVAPSSAAPSSAAPSSVALTASSISPTRIRPVSIRALKAERASRAVPHGLDPTASTAPRLRVSSLEPPLPPTVSAPVTADDWPILGHGDLPLTTAVRFLKGVGPYGADCLSQKGIQTLADLLWFLPRRYQERHSIARIGDLQGGQFAQVEGEIIAVSPAAGRRRLFELTLADDSGALLLTWFQMPGRGRRETYRKGVRLRATAAVKRYRNKLQMVHPEVSVLSAHAEVGEAPSASPVAAAEDLLVPLYAEIDGVPPKKLRAIIDQALRQAERVGDDVPAHLLERYQLGSVNECLRRLHQPPPLRDEPLVALQAGVSPWHQRLIYEELLLLQLAVLSRRSASALPGKPAAVLQERSFVALAAELFDFSLTGAQARVLAQLQADMISGAPMNRLVQGDVGCGKTAVALTLAAAAAEQGVQTALMAPTELLAEQHAHTALKIFGGRGVRVDLLTGSVTGKKRTAVLGRLKSGATTILIGTHALIQEGVEFHRLGLAIVDEQHRFGVVQRARLLAMGVSVVPHMLVMTATPIPRTLALTVYGDLDVAVIDELPPGRQAILTRLYRERQRADAYAAVRAQLETGRQAYVVLPLVEESDKDGMENIRDATSIAEELRHGPLAGFEVGLLHGRMKASEKEALMRRFAQGQVRALVATTVIEVGIDVANASVMVIEHAERFGLSQMHQLRGRVGRGAEQSYCFLVARYTPSEDAWRRLQVMVETTDGFRIAEEDLAIRGPGDVMGTRQSGLPMLQVANLARDLEWMQRAREDAKAILEQDPQLAAEEHLGLRSRLQGEAVSLVNVG